MKVQKLFTKQDIQELKDAKALFERLSNKIAAELEDFQHYRPTEYDLEEASGILSDMAVTVEQILGEYVDDIEYKRKIAPKPYRSEEDEYLHYVDSLIKETYVPLSKMNV